MARQIADIQAQIIAQVQGDPVLNTELTSTSKVSIWRLFTYAIAVCIWTLESIFDIHKQDINDQISNLKPHSANWYENKAKAFLYGYDLVDDADYYDTTGLTEAQITTASIIAYAKVVDQTRGIRMKLAKESGSDLVALTGPELTAFTAYMKEVKDAGVKVNITSSTADLLKLTMRIKFNPQVLNADGQRIDGTTNTPVQEAVRAFLKNLPFNGVFSIAKLVDAIQAVDGVTDLSIDLVQTKYGALPFTTIDIDNTPDAGYLRIEDSDLAITFIPA